ncbi:hypothetical protein FRC06_001844 [Ceratobasidium sp. 370]|nr:hypothetical protein FRC06_001844 [Ceratobasidium sp. 370]
MNNPSLDDEPALRPAFQNMSKGRDGESGIDEAEKLRRWQEERIERKLRGEYESYVRNLNELGDLLNPSEDALISSTDVGSNNDGSASVTARIRNAFGGAETVEGAVAFGTQMTRSGHLRCEWPVVVGTGEAKEGGDGSVRGEVGVFGVERDASWYASVKEGVKGFRACLRGQTVLGTHELAYEAAVRHVNDLSPNASLSMRQSAGYTSKSSISHTLTRDTRDDPLQGIRGSYLKYFTVCTPVTDL